MNLESESAFLMLLQIDEINHQDKCTSVEELRSLEKPCGEWWGGANPTLGQSGGGGRVDTRYLKFKQHTYLHVKMG